MAIYENIYDMLHYYIFGYAQMNSSIDLALTLVSLCACLFCVCIPFIIVWKLIKVICR